MNFVLGNSKSEMKNIDRSLLISFSLNKKENLQSSEVNNKENGEENKELIPIPSSI